MELDEIEEYQKPKAKTSSKRGRKTKKTNHTKSLSEPSEISHDEKSNIIESDSSPDVIDTTKIAKNMSLNNVIIDESLALEPPEKSSIDLVDAKIIKAELQETENLIQTKNDVIKNVLNVEKDEKKEPNVEENKIIVDKSSTNVVNVLIPVAIVEVVEAPTISVVEDGVLKVPQNQDENIEPVEEMDSTHEVQDEALIITSVEQVEKIAPVEAINCSEEVQDVAPMINVKCEKTEEIERIVEVQDSTPMIVGKDEKLQPGMKNNKNEMLEKLTVIKKEKETPENVPEKSPIKLVTRKSESYTIEETENTVERCESPDLMDESIVTIMDSPSMNASVLPKDSTFSPVVDISINDSRPTIDIPLLKRNNPLRTSTPLAPKLGLKSSETLNSKRKLMLNPLEKSILKSNHRKRSLSMTAGDSVMQKRVMFISPTVMDIESIDHKMMASFIEEKENSSKLEKDAIYFHFNCFLFIINLVMVTAAASGRRKRSMSETSTTPRAKIVSRVKIPNFNKLHEKQFQKMEDIAEFTKRKADRARKLATPTKPAAVPKAEVPIVVTKKGIVFFL